MVMGCSKVHCVCHEEFVCVFQNGNWQGKGAKMGERGQSQLMECWQNSHMNLLGKQHVAMNGCVKLLSHLGFLVEKLFSLVRGEKLWITSKKS